MTRYEAEIRRDRRTQAVLRRGRRQLSLHGGGDPDLFKAFAERFMRLVPVTGRVGCVLPRPLVSAALARRSLRRELFTRWTIQSADVLWNHRVGGPSLASSTATRSSLLAARSGFRRATTR